MMVWLAAGRDNWRDAFSFTGQQADYYNRLVDGFQAGRLHLAEAHPDRLSSDPAVRRKAPYLLDTSLYQGRYYLYYGVMPAVTVLLPYSALTGHDLSLNVPTLGFVLLGFLVSVRWYLELRRRYFPSTGSGIDGVVVLLLAFGPATTFLVRRSMFYELPLAAGYACLCLFIWSVTRALESPERGRRWLAAASTCAGLAAGCHPNYALLTPALAWVAWHRGRTPGPDRQGWTWAAAAVLPALILGLALAAYNHARFGSPLEFGFNYGMNVFFETGDKLVSARFLWPNIHWYYFTPPTLLPYFPFVFPADASFRPAGYHGAEAIHGQFLVLVTIVWIALGTIRWFRAAHWPGNLRPVAAILAWAFLFSATFICLLGIRANRYLVDFQLPLIALAALAIAGTGHAAPPSSRLFRAWRGILWGLVLAASAFNCLGAIQQFDDFRHTRGDTFRSLGRSLNPSWAFWNKLGLVRTGTLEMHVVFSAQAHPVGEPLLTLGVPGYSDTVYALQYPGNHVEFLVDHSGYGGPRTRLLPYEPGKVHELKIDLGGFHPPADDPFFAPLPASVTHRLKSTARLVFDGEVVLDLPMSFFEAAPWQRDFGTNHRTLTPFARTFSGQIVQTRWLPPPSQAELSASNPLSSVIRLAATFPPTMATANQPLIGFGRSGKGTLLYLEPVAPGKWRVGLDAWGHGSPPAVDVEIPPGPHTVDLFIGPLGPADAWAANSSLAAAVGARRRELALWIDGVLAARFSLQYHLDAFDNGVAGANLQGFSTSAAQFYGELRATPLDPKLHEELLRRAVGSP